jgi:hypothetical protein
MSFQLGIWPPLLSHTVIFVMGMCLVCLTMEEEFVPLKIRERQVIFSLDRKRLNSHEGEMIYSVGSRATLSQRDPTGRDCRVQPMPVQVIANGAQLLLSTSAKHLVRLQGHLTQSESLQYLTLESSPPKSKPGCHSTSTVIHD